MLTFTAKYNKNEGIVISPFELLDQYLYGIKIQNRLGTEMNVDNIKLGIQAAQKELEQFLDIKFWKQVIEETIPFYRSDFESWGYAPVSYPARECYKIEGYFNTVKQITYPVEWFSTRRTSDGETYYRQIFLVPSGVLVGSSTGASVYSGITPHLNFLGQQTLPNYWKIRYLTGFDTIPKDIIRVVGMLASLNIFYQLGDIILGPGISNISLGVDGLSQSVSSTNTAGKGAYAGRIQAYTEELKRVLPIMKGYYKGLVFMAC